MGGRARRRDPPRLTRAASSAPVDGAAPERPDHEPPVVTSADDFVLIGSRLLRTVLALSFARLAWSLGVWVIVAASSAVAAPRACTQACKEGRTTCVAVARDDFTSAKAGCPASGAVRRRCIKAGKRAFGRDKHGCEAFRRNTCMPCCRAGGTVCTSTTSTTSTLAGEATTTTTSTLPADPCTPGAAPPTGFQDGLHITSSGADRTYARFVPPDYDPSQPHVLVFGFHGDGGTGADIRDALGLEAQADGAAVFVYPDATEDSGRSFDLETPLASNADMHLFLDLVASIEASYCIDPQHVFATGVSRGAFFVNFLNCRLGAPHLRAIAAQSGSGPYGDDSDYDVDGHFICEAPAAAALMIHGTADDVVPISDGEYSHGQWVWADGCSDTTTPIDPAPCVAHDGCDPGKPVVWCAVPGLGHEVWSSAPEAVWNFFAGL